MRRFGFALLMTMAVAAWPAAASAADGLSIVTHPEIPAAPPTLEAEEYPSEISGERYENGPTVGEIVLLSVNGGEVSCEVAELDGGELAEPAEALTLDASYSECTMGAAGATASMNSCSYEHPGFEALGGGMYSSDAAIACDKKGDAISITTKGGCNATIPAQDLSAEFDPYPLNGEDVVLEGLEGSGLQYTLTGSFCPLVFGKSAGSYEDGSSISHLTLRGIAS